MIDKKNMRVLFIAYQKASDFTMLSQGISYLAGLKKNGIDFTVLTFETPDSLPKSRQIIDEFSLTECWSYNFYHMRPRLLAKSFDILTGLARAAVLIRKRDVDLIHARGVMAAVIAFLPSRIFGKKVLFDTRGLLADKYVGGRLLKKRSLVYSIIKAIENYLLKKTCSFVVETSIHKKIIGRCQPYLYPKANVVPCCVDLSAFGRSAAGQSKIIFAYVGNIGTWYLLKEMVDFYKAFLKISPGASFKIINEHINKELLFSLSNARGREDIPGIELIEPNNRRDIPRLLSEATVGIFFINPYRRFNTSPIKYAEYLASGLPVVINSKVGDTSHITKKERVGVVIPSFREESYVSASLELLALLKEGTALNYRCLETAKKYFSLDEGLRKYRHIYNNMLRP